MTEEELKQCKLCGGYNNLIRNEPNGLWKVRCGNDYSQTLTFPTPEQAIHAWNDGEVNNLL